MFDKKGAVSDVKKLLFIFPIIIGISLIVIGACVEIPSTKLEDSVLNLDDEDYSTGDYSLIDEYVNGDAYNYIIGASLVGGQISGATVSKTIYYTGGAICLCIGMLMYVLIPKGESKKAKEIEKINPSVLPPTPVKKNSESSNTTENENKA